MKFQRVFMNPILLLQIAVFVLGILCTFLYAHQFVYLFLPFFGKKRTFGEPVFHKYAVLIPARNEENVLPHLLSSLAAQDYPQELLTVYVIADNCTDKTADVARAAGARVVERENKVQVGKGYALNYLFGEIEKTDGLDSFDAFLVFDADNLLKSDYISRINEVYSAGYEVFCGYRNTKNFADSAISAGYAVWYLHDSCHLNESRMMIGSSCNVNGTGFGFSRSLLKKIGSWQFFTLTEDIEFSTWCATHGVKIGYCRDAILFDEQPLTISQSCKQRIRWVQGGLQVSLRRGGEILRALVKGRGWRLYAAFETFALSLWGYIFGIASALGGLTLAGLLGGFWTFLLALVVGVGGAVLSFLAIGALTVFTQWDRIHATKNQKIMSIFAFPFFMISFVPIAMVAPFKKFHWAPIEHTVAVSVDEIEHRTEND
ncbi:MAG: glycosyltransferase family 2 protein [Clostridia bacterium]|nr:glycosyltransferase family 2 protein [Clostridia bacterium]